MIKIIVPVEFIFAIEGQLYSTDNFDDTKAKLSPQDYQKLVDDTVGQYAFMLALKSVSPMILSKPGLHPNIYKVAKFEKEDDSRLEKMKRTIDWLKEHDTLGMAKYDIDKMMRQGMHKLISEISQTPNAWTPEGKLKPEYQPEYMKKRLGINLSNL